jgi:hypothetical protein
LAYARNERMGENSEMEQRDLGWLEVKDRSLGKARGGAGRRLPASGELVSWKVVI